MTACPRFRWPRRGGRAARRAALILTLLGVFVVAPAGAANAEPLWWQAITDPGSICAPSDPVPETAGTGLSGLVDPPGPQPPTTHYNDYEMAGLTWHATDLGCGDYLAIVGNYAANFVFMIAKAFDRVTITAYQTAYSPGLLDSLSGAVTSLVTSLRDTFYLPYVTPVVLLGVIWLAWQGLIRRRATTSFEGVVWMIIAVTLALWFLNRPTDILRAGNSVVNGANCAITKGVAQVDPNTDGQCFAEGRQGPSSVAQTADSLWTVLAYRPWVAGEFGAGASRGSSDGVPSALAHKYGGFGSGSLLWTQAISHKDLNSMRSGGSYDAGAATALMNQKHDRWTAIKEDIKNNHPSVYPLFQGRQWGARLGIAFAAFIASIFAGGLILLVSVALIVLKLGFLLLIMTGPFFLLAGIHPGVGRVIALRWAELLVGTVLKQIVVALALAVLLFGYSVITTGSNLSWGLQILLLSLLGIAAFIYRKPFQHLFASVGGGFGGRVVSESARTNAELASAHRRFAAAPAGPPVVRRIGGRLASTALGGAVAGAVGGKAGAAAAASSTAGGRGNRHGGAGADGTAAAAAQDGAASATGDDADGGDVERDERKARHRRLAGLGGGPRTGTPPPLDLSERRSGPRGRGREAATGSGIPTSPGHSGPNGQPPPSTPGEYSERSPRPVPENGNRRAEPPPPPPPSPSPRSNHGSGAAGGRGADRDESADEAWWQRPARRRRPQPPPEPPQRARARDNAAGESRPHHEDGSAHPRGDPAHRPSRRTGSRPPLPFWLRSGNGDEDER